MPKDTLNSSYRHLVVIEHGCSKVPQCILKDKILTYLGFNNAIVINPSEHVQKFHIFFKYCYRK